MTGAGGNLTLNPVFDAPHPARPSGSRLNRPIFMGFVGDADSAHVLRAALGPIFPLGLTLHQISFRATIELLGRIETPETILVDISGEDQPLTAILQLESVVDPGTRVLVIGDNRSVSFYRTLTRNLGVKEYLPKPLDAAMVAREFLPWAAGKIPEIESARGGAMIAICGTRGGIGVTTLATNLAWLIGAETRRHTILLDADLQRGSAALAMNVPPSTGLRAALEAPDRIDPLLIERAAHPAAERLHVLAAEEPLAEKFSCRPGGGRALSAALRQRYNFVIADIPSRPLGFAAEILGLAQQRVLVIDSSAQSLNHAKRWLALPPGPMQTMRPIVVLNRYQRQRAITPSRIEALLQTNIAVVVPDITPAVARAGDLGDMIVARKGKFRDALVKLAQVAGAGAASVSG